MSASFYTTASPVPLASAVSIVDVGKGQTVAAMPQDGFALPAVRSGSVDQKQMQRLIEQGYTRGLAQSLNQAKQAFALRIWIVDNSGSMHKTDGHRVVETSSSSDVRMVACSRWEEIRECVSYHINLSGSIAAPSSFRLLNDPGVNAGQQQFTVAESPDKAPYDIQDALSVIRKVRPGGCTPLTQHIYEIHRSVSSMVPQLRQLGQRVVIVIATDGLPTDERGYGGEVHQREFVDALRLLEGLPVWVVIRLCTDEEDVVGFYNDLDALLELSVEVLDDFIGEAAEVYEQNPWLNYALPLHRLREMGYHDRVFDMLDERLLTRSEVRDFCALLFGEDHFDGVPDPSLDWKGFSKEVDRLLKREKMQWNPMKKKVTPWINMKKLNKLYGGGSHCIIL